MKKIIAAVLALMCALSFAGCAAQEVEVTYDLIPMAMVDGELYLDTGYNNNTVKRCGTFDGEITSTVAGSEKPSEDDQSNFGTGYGYQYGAAGTIEVAMDGKWRIFATETVRQQMQFPGKDDPSSESEALREPPDLTVVLCGNVSIKAMKGTYSWSYQNADGAQTGIEADSLHPLNAKEHMPCLQLLPVITSSRSPLEAELRWDFAPDKVSLRCWKEDAWGQPDAEYEAISVQTLMLDSDPETPPIYSVELKDGNYIYEVTAEWNRSEQYGGTVRYYFYTEKADVEDAIPVS